MVLELEDSASVIVTIDSGPFFTCQVQGIEVGTYQKVSLIVIYSSNQSDNIVQEGSFGWNALTLVVIIEYWTVSIIVFSTYSRSRLYHH